MPQVLLLSAEQAEAIRERIRQIAECPESFRGTPTAEVLADVIDTKGKMVRPALLLACAGFGPEAEQENEKLILLCALLELTHMTSLIHDDIIDDAPLRRGKPSVQSKYGKDAAVYAGDFLFSRINYWEIQENLGSEARLLAKAVEQMCAGEIGQDLCKFRPDTTCEQYFQNISGKTCALFRTACHLGASAAGCDAVTVEKLEQLGSHLGVMFQLRDDLLDYSPAGCVDGKATRRDLQEGIYTLPVLLALQTEEGKQKLLPALQENAARLLSDAKLREMEQLVEQCGGIRATREEIARRADLCRAILSEMPPCAAREELGKMISLLCKHE